MRLRIAALLLCGWFALLAADIAPARFLEHVKHLASEQMKGRGTGTPELEMVAEYIALEFQEAGLEQVSSDGWFQAFSVTTNAELGEANRLAWTMEDNSATLDLQTDFIPLNFSSGGTYSGQVVFAGYGITAPEYDYDDYTGQDVEGKFVLVLRHEPQENNEDSVFAGSIYTEHSQLPSKAMNAKLHGAIGVLMVNDPFHHDSSDGQLTKFEGSAGPGEAGIPFVHIGVDVVRDWMWFAGKDLDSVERSIDQDLTPYSFPFPETLEVSLTTDLSREPETVHNVAGYLPGRTPEYVIVGAHYDHLGLGEQFSMAPSLVGTPHPGADDNASGTAGVIELAREMASEPVQERGVLFLAFASEELGLLGSSHYVRNPLLPIENAVAMVNFDMIGRVRGGKAYVGGVDTGSTFSRMLDSLLPVEGLDVELSGVSGYGSSDHTAFMANRVPTLLFSSGMHDDYHRPSDTWKKINAAGAVRILELVAGFVDKLRDGAPRPGFVSMPVDRSTESRIRGR